MTSRASFASADVKCYEALQHSSPGKELESKAKFSIVLDGETVTNLGIASELLIRRAEKLKNRVCEEVCVGRFAGFELFVRTNLGGEADLVLRGKNSHAARVTDTALGTIRSLWRPRSKPSRSAPPSCKPTSPMPTSAQRNSNPKSALRLSTRSVISI